MASYYSIADIVQATLFNDEKAVASNIDSTLLRSYPAANMLVKKNVAKEQSGLDYRWPVNLRGASGATTFGPYHRPTRSVGDHLGKATMQLRNLRTDFSCDEIEDEMNSGAHEIVDVIKLREQNAMIDLTKLIETKFWTFADTDDDESPQGILYYLPYCATRGFVGTVSGSHTTVANLNPSTYTGWKSFGAPYTAVTEDDLIFEITNAMDKTDFQSPLGNMLVGEPGKNGQMFGLYTNLDVRQQVVKKARDNNDNLGPDVDALNATTNIRGTAITAVPYLDDNTRDPVIGINWNQIQNRVRRGWWMKRKMIKDDPVQPLTVSVDIYCIYQLIMLNRRLGGFNIAKAA